MEEQTREPPKIEAGLFWSKVTEMSERARTFRCPRQSELQKYQNIKISKGPFGIRIEANKTTTRAAHAGRRCSVSLLRRKKADIFQRWLPVVQVNISY